MVRTRKPFRSLGRDLYFDLSCTCTNPLFEGTSVADIMTHSVKLVGYADDNFFDNVNAAPRIGRCKCGREFRYQWFRDGVEAVFHSAREAADAAGRK